MKKYRPKSESYLKEKLLPQNTGSSQQKSKNKTVETLSVIRRLTKTRVWSRKRLL